MSPGDPIVVLLFSVLIFGSALWGLMRAPRREPRIAVLSGALLGGMLLGLREVFAPATPGGTAQGGMLQLAASMLSVLTLVMVVVADREVRRSFRHPLWVSLVATVPGVLLVCALLVAVETGRGFDLLSVIEALPPDAILAATAFLGPPVLFEMLWRTSLWAGLPTDEGGHDGG